MPLSFRGRARGSLAEGLKTMRIGKVGHIQSRGRGESRPSQAVASRRDYSCWRGVERLFFFFLSRPTRRAFGGLMWLWFRLVYLGTHTEVLLILDEEAKEKKSRRRIGLKSWSAA